MLRALARGWVDPRAQMQRLVAAPVSEARALSWLYLACIIGLLAGLPDIGAQVAALTAQGVPDATVAVVTGRLLGALFFAPLAFYGLAAVAHLGARVLGGTGDWYSARLALFWSLLMLSPVLLVLGLAPQILASEVGLGLLNAAGLLGFLWVWARNFGVVSEFRRVWPVFSIMIIALVAVSAILRSVAVLTAT